MPTTESVLDEQLNRFGEQDMQGVLELYSEDSVVITNGTVLRGLDEIEGLFESLFAEFSHDEATFQLEDQVVDGDFGYIIWMAETPENIYEFASDTYYIPDDTIEFQSFAGNLTEKS